MPYSSPLPEPLHERRDRRCFPRPFVLGFSLVLAASLSGAQTPEVSELGIDQLRSLVGEQQRLLEQQRDQLDSQAATLQLLVDRLDQLSSAEASAVPDGETTQAAADVPPPTEGASTAAEEQEADLNINSRQENVAVSGEFPGAIQLPGTQIGMRPGGFVGLNLVQSSKELGISDRFITASIPVGSDTLDGGGGASVSARNSRLNLEVRRASEYGEFRAFVEGDFLGTGANGSDVFRLRHAFGQFKGLTIGQTWSTFVNPFTGPEDIDLEGINADILIRQPLARWQVNRSKGKLAFSIEQPDIELTGGTGQSRYWDLLGRYSRGGERRSFYVSGVARQVSGEPTAEEGSPSVDAQRRLGLGFTGGMNVTLPRLGPSDGIQFTATLGEGISSYINDLNAAGGLDGYFDPETGNLETPFATSLVLSYRHFWPFSWRNFRTMRSSFTLGLVRVDYPTEVEDDFLDRTVRGSVNLLWSPLTGVDLGIEFLWGQRRNYDGETGTASQLQFATFYRF